MRSRVSIPADCAASGAEPRTRESGDWGPPVDPKEKPHPCRNKNCEPPLFRLQRLHRSGQLGSMAVRARPEKSSCADLTREIIDGSQCSFPSYRQVHPQSVAGSMTQSYQDTERGWYPLDVTDPHWKLIKPFLCGNPTGPKPVVQSTGTLDDQSVKTGIQAETRGHDVNKRLNKVGSIPAPIIFTPIGSSTRGHHTRAGGEPPEPASTRLARLPPTSAFSPSTLARNSRGLLTRIGRLCGGCAPVPPRHRSLAHAHGRAAKCPEFSGSVLATRLAAPGPIGARQQQGGDHFWRAQVDHYRERHVKAFINKSLPRSLSPSVRCSRTPLLQHNSPNMRGHEQSWN